jgi:hypothetical protein
MKKRHEDLVTVQVALQISRSALATGVVDATLRRTFTRCDVCGKRLYRVGLSGGEGEPIEKLYLCNGCEEVFSQGRQGRWAWDKALYAWLVGTVVPYVFEFEAEDDAKAAGQADGDDFDAD